MPSNVWNTKFTRLRMGPAELTQVDDVGGGFTRLKLSSVELETVLESTTYDLPLDVDRVVRTIDRRGKPPIPVTVRMHLGLSVTPDWSKVERMEPAEFNLSWLHSHGLKAGNLLTAGLRPADIRRMGVKEPYQLRELGFDALTLADAEEVWIADAIKVWGADEIAQSFICCSTDAVNAAGSRVRCMLGVGVSRLLECSHGRPGEAAAVLQLEGRGALEGVDPQVLVQTGITADMLKKLGYTLETVLAAMHPTAPELAQLGFRF